ncbi:MAG: CHAP domain-containing protein [Alphaproteobacteria bacterium]
MKNLANPGRKPSASRTLAPWLSAAALASATVLAACAAPTTTQTGTSAVTARYSQPEIELEEQVGFLSCVPYARSISGVKIFGDAWTWWKSAEGKYAKGKAPQKGAVLTLQRTKSLPLGHVAVVAATSEDPRKLWVDHANWGDNGDTRGKIHKRQPVIDVSKANDWSEVRFMNTVGTFGRIYPAHGFIYNGAPASPQIAPPAKPQIAPPAKPVVPLRTASAAAKN